MKTISDIAMILLSGLGVHQLVASAYYSQTDQYHSRVIGFLICLGFVGVLAGLQSIREKL